MIPEDFGTGLDYWFGLAVASIFAALLIIALVGSARAGIPL